LQAVLDKYDLDNPSQEKVDEYMGKSGYAKDANGLWAKDGTVLTVNVRTPAFIQPTLAPLTQQLKEAGFDAVQAPVDDTWLPDMQNGNFDTMIFVHCGSLSEPLETLQHYHSKFSRPLGEIVPNLVAGSRYSNPEYDAIIDRMDAVTADTNPDSQYMKDAVAALDMALRDLPQIDMLEEFHVVTFNTTYWTGWPSSADPYVAPYTPWEAFNLVVHNLKPTGAQ
jgi:peptide/nickel transport system substrate-binding protein